MRDPLGNIKITDQKVVRTLNQPIAKSSYLFQSDAKHLVNQKKLVPYQFESDIQITSPRVPFVTYPHEWCDAQLYAAAQLTLDVSEICEASGFELKDASSWNVIFTGTQAVFCDHLSFQKFSKKSWWAFAQYIRHFILPLCIAKYAGLNGYETFRISRDGLKPEQAKSLLGLRRFCTRYWPLLLNTAPANLKEYKQEKDTTFSHHRNLYSLLRYFLQGVKPKAKVSVWSDYTDLRDHYSDESHKDKNKKIHEWLEKTKPKWITDFGCNTGEYTRIANEHGANVIAVDLDHECVQKLYLSEIGNDCVYPVVADLEDVFNGRGWAGTEFESLVNRIARVNELGLMLALIHHLAISNSIPYIKIAEFAREVTKKWLIVEFMNHSDPLVIHLCQQRDRSAEEFSIEQQLAAFNTYFDVLDTHQIINTQRTLCLLKARGVE